MGQRWGRGRGGHGPWREATALAPTGPGPDLSTALTSSITLKKLFHYPKPQLPLKQELRCCLLGIININ